LDQAAETSGASGLRAFTDLRASVVKIWSLAAVAALGGCSFGQSGIEPPADRIFLPAGIVADTDENLLYVVNSNSDLRFNAGTIAVVDLNRADAVLAQAQTAPYPVCAKTRFSRTEAVADDYCCRDLTDSNLLNCNEPQFIQADATVALGSFGSAIELQRFPRDPNDPTSAVVRRLFVAVRAEPSITYADVTVQGGMASIRCTGPRQGGPAQAPGAYCDDNWRIRRPSGVTAGALVLPEEPHVLSLDDDLGILYVGHLTVNANGQVEGGGVSTVDVCEPQSESSVRFAGVARTTFLPASLSQAVAELSPADPADPTTRLYATARYSAAISGLVLRDPSQAACAGAERDLTMVPAEAFYSPAFLPRGADIRGIIFSGDKAFILHRNDADTAANPPAIAVVARTRLADGSVSNVPLGVLEVCSGPTAMQMYPAGQGDTGGRIYVTCYDDGQICVVDPDTLTITATIDVGAGPTSLVFSQVDPGFAYVASYANSHLSVIDFRPGSPTENHVILRIGLPHGYGE
jgi:YVTN family beta-propeller protein